ncbi:MAG: hypothetical protein ACR2JW_07475 [Thermomicrobiales bacterium]
MEDRLYIVTGAPGAGKSATLDAFLALQTAYVGFDIDWLASTASDLAGTSIILDQTTWRPYRALWFEVLHAIMRNGSVPVLFASIDREDIAGVGSLAWCGGIDWLLLDCDDHIRRERLTRREGWTAAMVEDAILDAMALRSAFSTTVDTGRHLPRSIAARVVAWLDQCRKGSAP